MNNSEQCSRKVAQWLPPRTSSANREVSCLSLTVSTDDPLGLASLTLCLVLRILMNRIQNLTEHTNYLYSCANQRFGHLRAIVILLAELQRDAF